MLELLSCLKDNLYRNIRKIMEVAAYFCLWCRVKSLEDLNFNMCFSVYEELKRPSKQS